MITAIITDFDGTLVDTFKANFYAYQEAFDKVGLILTEEQYRECFGFRFEKFMQAVGVTDSDLIQRIKDEKLNAYPKYFEHLRPNTALIQLLQSMRENGCQIAIASTARMENLMNVLTYLNLHKKQLICQITIPNKGTMLYIIYNRYTPWIYNNKSILNL